MITPTLEAAINRAFEEANKRSHEYVTLEHLLYTLLFDPDAILALKACRVNNQVLKEELEQFFNEEVLKKANDRPAQPTNSFNRTIQRAVIHAQHSSREEVTGADILIHMFHEEESYALFLLKRQDISKIDLLSYVAHGIKKYEEESNEEEVYDDDEESKLEKQKTTLEQFTVNMNLKAKAGKIDTLIGREKEIERLMQVLCRRKKNNPILVGEPGVGKTAIVEGLAEKIVQGKVPALLKDITIFNLDLGALLAGTKFRGEFEDRFKKIIEELKQNENSVLFIDEIHTIIGAGATEGAMDSSNMLKPVLNSGELKCIGSTTYQEFRNVFSKNAAFSRRFQKVDVSEPNVSDSVKILIGLKLYFEKHHDVKYSTRAITSAVELSQKHIHDRFLPDKAIDIIDEAGSANRLLPKSKRKSVITEKDIESIMAKQANIPLQSVTTDYKNKLRNLERDLKILIFGQDEAITKICSAIKLSKSGLSTEEKPISSFLFAGPTGVGKTELAKQLSSALGIHFARFDMSEYMEKHAVSRLIGAPPGYVGFDQGGLLTEEINKHPHSVLLLDEIEKAHPDLNNILLQVLDYGFLTDNNGKKSNFRHCIIIMTTNAGAYEQAQNSIGFSPSDKGKAINVIKRTFSPEFINRLDGMIHFNNLEKKNILNVVDKFLIELEQLLNKKSVVFSASVEVREWLAEKGYNSKYGARPIHRLIQEKIKKNIVEELLFGLLEKGGRVDLSIVKNEIHFEYASLPPKVESKKNNTQRKIKATKITAKSTAKKDK